MGLQGLSCAWHTHVGEKHAKGAAEVLRPAVCLTGQRANLMHDYRPRVGLNGSFVQTLMYV